MNHNFRYIYVTNRDKSSECCYINALEQYLKYDNLQNTYYYIQMT